MEIILGSGVLAALISALLSFLVSSKENKLKYVTEERRKWREDIRSILEGISASFEKSLREPLAMLAGRLNAYGMSGIIDYLKDSHIWRVIRSLESDISSDREVDKTSFEAKKSLLLDYLSILLKYDWERAKSEIGFNRYRVTAAFCAVISCLSLGFGCYYAYVKEYNQEDIIIYLFRYPLIIILCTLLFVSLSSYGIKCVLEKCSGTALNVGTINILKRIVWGITIFFRISGVGIYIYMIIKMFIPLKEIDYKAVYTICMLWSALFFAAFEFVSFVGQNRNQEKKFEYASSIAIRRNEYYLCLARNKISNKDCVEITINKGEKKYINEKAINMLYMVEDSKIVSKKRKGRIKAKKIGKTIVVEYGSISDFDGRAYVVNVISDGENGKQRKLWKSGRRKKQERA